MSEVEYVRVNVNSAVAPPVLDSDGNTKGEVELQLPSNLVFSADNVLRARMGVMKMQIPLGALPSTSAKVKSVMGTNDVMLNCKVIPCPWNVRSWRTFDPNLRIKPFRANSLIHSVNLTVDVSDVTKTPAFEVERGYHEFKTLTEFLKSFSTAIGDSMMENLNPNLYNVNPQAYRINVAVNSDNTLSLNWAVLDHNAIFPAGFPNPSLAGHPQPIQEMYFYSNLTDPTEPTQLNPYGMDFYIGVNSDVVQILPTLPWIKVPRPRGMSDLQWDEPYIYALDTKVANIIVHRDEHHIIRQLQEPTSSQPGFWGQFFSNRYEFQFTESDAVTNTDVSAIVLTMSGADFSQQVYPVNYNVSTTSSALTTTVPIIEVYYPLWTKPSDKSTDLIVSKEDFENAAPIVINPNLFKERVIKYKLHYITSTGEMREMLLPPSSPFAIQIVFELLKEKATFVPMT